MKRTPLKRGPPLRAWKPLKRTKFKARGKRTKRSGGHLFPRSVDAARRAFVRTFPCAPCLASGATQRTKTQACHLKSRGAGGPDAGNLWPGCERHHIEQHTDGLATFQRRYRLNLARICERIEASYVKQERFVT